MRAAPSLSPPFTASGDPHNAFTVDLEEWFHVCGVEPLRFERWAALPSRVEPTTRWLLDMLESGRGARHVLRRRLGRRAVSAARGGGARRGSRESGRTAMRTGGCTSSTARRSGAIVQASVRALKTVGVERCVVVQGARMVRERPFALGARRARRGGVSSRREHGSVADGRIAAAFRGIRTYARPARGRSSRCPRSWPIGSDR